MVAIYCGVTTLHHLKLYPNSDKFRFMFYHAEISKVTFLVKEQKPSHQYTAPFQPHATSSRTDPHTAGVSHVNRFFAANLLDV